MKNSKSVIEKRHSQIQKILFEKGSATTEELAETLKVSTATIRHDLVLLANKGLLRRTFGGAEFPHIHSDPKRKDPVAEKTSEVRKKICSKAAGLLEDGDSVLVNSSATARYLLDHARSKELTIITNNQRMLNSDPGKTTLISTGGTVDPSRNSLTGPIMLNTVERTLTGKCILGVRSISAETGITLTEMDEAAAAQKMIEQTNDQVIVIAEGFKIGKKECFIAGSIEKVDTLITDETADAEAVKKIQEAGVTVYIV